MYLFEIGRLWDLWSRRSKQPPKDLPARTTLKEVLELIDPLSLISTELFHLAEWVSDYYFASKGEVLRSCLPPKSNPRSRQTVVLLQGGLDALERDDLTSELSLKERKLLRVLREHQALETKELGQRAGFEIGERDLRGLVFNQCVQIQHELARTCSSAARPEERCFEARRSTRKALKLTPQQNRVVQALKARAEPVSVSALLEELSISPSALNSLHRRGLVVFSSEAVRRDPLKQVSSQSSFQPALAYL